MRQENLCWINRKHKEQNKMGSRDCEFSTWHIKNEWQELQMSVYVILGQASGPGGLCERIFGDHRPGDRLD